MTCRRLIELINDLEYYTILPDNPTIWIDEEYLFHDDYSRNILKEILNLVDNTIGLPSGGYNTLVLDTMRVAGIQWRELTLGRLAFLTRKGMILIVKPR